MTEELSPLPEPKTEPAELVPGGVDAIEEPRLPPLGHDLVPQRNAALDESEPEELKEPEGATQAPTDGRAEDSGSEATA